MSRAGISVRLAMWHNYLTVAVRRRLADRAYSAITVGGLALGLAGCLLILGYVRYERSYDAWLPGQGNVYQVQSTIRPPGQPIVHTQKSAFVLYDQLAASFPQVEAVTSVSIRKLAALHDGQLVNVEATIVDPSFPAVFPLRFIQGTAATAFRDPDALVLTETEARRWFGTAAALGRRLTLGTGGAKRDYRVTGVLANLPRNTNLKLGLVLRRNLNALPPEARGWGNFDNQHYVRLRPGADPAAINRGLPAWEKRVIPTITIAGKPAVMSDVFDFALVPIADVHLGTTQEGALVPGGDPRTLATFGVVALLTLGMAVINYVNLSTARATRRAREVALRKVLGATRAQLIAQFFGEGVLICALAMLLGVAAVELATRPLGALLGAGLQVTYLGRGGMLLPATALLLVTAVTGALYPAFYLSRFRPAAVLRANQASIETPGSGRLRAALVVAQFAIAIGLIASTAVIWSQTRFVQAVDPGYRRDGLVQIDDARDLAGTSKYDAARAALLSIPGVTAVGRTGLGLGSTDRLVSLVRRPGADTFLSMGQYTTDAELPRTMGIGLKAGRLLDEHHAQDRVEGLSPAELVRRGLNVVVSEAARRAFGFDSAPSALGQPIEIVFFDGTIVPATVVGVLGDTRYRTARDAIEPMIYTFGPASTHVIMVRYTAARPANIMAALNGVWHRFEPEVPLQARFVDDIVREIYAADRARAVLFACFAGLAVVIACLGLYSLAAFAAERRTKEIGIRKVLGARVRHIVQLLVWQFSRPVVAANLVAWPVAWWAMRDWLNTFDVRIALTPMPFLFAGLGALAIALATVAGHALRVARTHPIHALRYE